MANHIVLDLEMCMVPNVCKTEGFQKTHELIQIGAIKLDENYNEISRLSQFVRPQYGFIDAFIEQLTGITPDDIVNAPIFEEAIDIFLNWIGEEEAICVSWSDSDKYQLRSEMKEKKVVRSQMDVFFNTWVDCQQLFGQKLKTSRHISLEEALIASDIFQEGRAHDGLTDAVNTSKLYRKLRLEPDFKLREDYAKAKEAKVDHLQYSLAGLFSGLNLDLPEE